MKKILFSLFLLSCIPFQIFAINGDGSYGSPYNGSLTANMNWSGTVYVNGDVTVDGYTLTISPGAIIVFLIPSSDLIITGTGVLTADGTNASMIRFTADSDNSGTFGGPGETWGHISFQYMGSAGSSSITFCIFEYGRKDGYAASLDGVGGGLQVDFDNITISDCIFRHNYASFGGGIFINVNRTPLISSCIFLANTANSSGGGIYSYDSSAPTISNCIFDNNNAAGIGNSTYAGGAIQFGLSITNAKVLNCTFVNNSAVNTGGDALHFYSGGTVVNSIFWGSNNQIGFSTSGGIIDHSAIQGYSAGSHFTNCFGLNSSNTASDGPNFIAIDGSNWSIQFVSPCRDAGTSSGAPSTDILGKPRIGPYDIGAYEVQYSRWKTNASANTDWFNTGNWELGFEPGHSGTTGDVVIPALLNDTYAPNISGTTTIASGKYLILEENAKATLSTISNSGTLKLMSGTNIFSLITNSYTRNSGGTEQVGLYLAGASGINMWHYISSPFTSLSIDPLKLSSTQDLARFVESLPITSLVEGWIGWDGWNYYDNGNPLTGYAFSNLAPGYGYNILYRNNYLFTLSGLLNTSDVSPTITYSGASPALNGFNLLGNPFSSGLDWDVVAANPSYPANTSKSIYFTRNTTVQDENCYYINGTGSPVDVTGIIPPMQGFFVNTTNTSTTLSLLASARVHNNIHPRYKGTTGTIPLIRLSLSDNGTSDETVVRFDELAKAGFDYDFDAAKISFSSGKTSIYSSVSGTNYAINGQPFPGTFVEIPIVVNLITSGNHTISTLQLQGLDNYEVTLTDKTTGFKADLKATPSLAFSGSQGLIADRFILTVKGPTGIEDPAISKNTFNIYPANNFINIQTLSDDWDGKTGSVNVLDLTGKTVSSHNNSVFSKNSLIQVSSPVTKGLYVVEIKSGLMRYVGKVVIR